MPNRSLAWNTTVDPQWKYYAITSVEHSGLESPFSAEVAETGGRSFYFEAENMKLTPPARHFFDGYCTNFQCVRINAESDEEQARPGEVTVPLGNLPQGHYQVWGRVKGQGSWTAGEGPVKVSADDWTWVKIGSCDAGDSSADLHISSPDDNLKLDLVLLTQEDFTPQAAYPADAIAPEHVKGLKAMVSGKQVRLSWMANPDADLHHYSVYCGDSPDFTCDNTTLIRSVLKTGITDVLPEVPRGKYYKVVAVDNQWNTGEAATVKVN